MSNCFEMNTDLMKGKTMYDKKNYVKNTKKIGAGKHFAIITFDSTYVPGDERSRTNPGHGYPAHSVDHCSYVVYETKESWERDIERYVLNKTKFIPIIGEVPVVETKVTVTV